MKQFRLIVMEPEGVCYEGPCESLVVPASDGKYGIMANHRNMISGIIPGLLSYRVPGGEKKYLSVSFGFVKAQNNEVLVMVDAAERPEDIDANRAQRDLDAAKELMLQNRSMRDYRTGQANLAKAMNRLRVRRGYENQEWY